MGREIEFRAWNKYHKKMHSVYEINFDHSIAKTRENENDSTYTFGFIDLELMQFTGLRDKNGVKIFEGDIVDFNGGDICEVFFENGCFWAGNEQLSKHPIGQWLHYSESAVVIGNIHQHPHLLDK